MKRCAMTTMVAVLVLAAVTWSAGRTQAQGDPKVMLSVVQDEGSLEKAIQAYIKAAAKVEAEVKSLEGDSKDIYLEYVLTPEKAPKIKLTVDTEPTSKDGDKVLERAVYLQAFFVLPDYAKVPAVRLKFLELNNTFHQHNWVPDHVYLDEDGDVVFESYINIPGEKYPIPAELVLDKILRSLDSWTAYYAEADKILKAAKPAEKTE